VARSWAETQFDEMKREMSVRVFESHVRRKRKSSTCSASSRFRFAMTDATQIKVTQPAKKKATAIFMGNNREATTCNSLTN
jgi:hypothetical protein